MKRALLWGMAATGLLLVVSLGILIAMTISRSNQRERAALVPDHGLETLRMPDYALTDQDGAPVGPEIFNGRITVVDFIFTNCPFVCPALTATMQGLTADLAGTGARFVSISVDPDHDTPDRLKEYAVEHAVDESRWRFLTGDLATIERIVRDALMFALQKDETRPIALDDGSTMLNIMHPSRLVIVGPDRGVIAMYDYQYPEQLDMLRARARAAAAALAVR